MRGSWRVARIAGIDVSLHWSFGLLLAWVLLSAAFSGGVFAAVGEVGFVSLLFACVVLHELGHALAARLFGIPTHGITLLPIGGVAQLDRIPRNPWQEFVIAIAGPAVNVLIAAALFFLIMVSVGLGQVQSVDLLTGSLLPRLLVVNVLLVAFNLLPAFPMDGGRILRAFLAMMTDYTQATRWAVRIGQAVALLFAVAALFNPMLLLIAAFVALAAEAELRQVLAESAGYGLPSRAYPSAANSGHSAYTSVIIPPAPPTNGQGTPSVGLPKAGIVVWTSDPAAAPR